MFELMSKKIITILHIQVCLSGPMIFDYSFSCILQLSAMGSMFIQKIQNILALVTCFCVLYTIIHIFSFLEED